MSESKIILLTGAIRKIQKDAKLFPGKLPMLHYYLNMYSNCDDGTKIQFGSGFSLSFKNEAAILNDHDEAVTCTPVHLADETVCYVRIPITMRGQPIVIDHVGMRFVRLG